MKTIVLLVALLAFASATLVRNHEFWYTAQKSLVKSNIPYSDFAWNYCDLKCLYFEHYYPTVDFVYIDFNPGFFSPSFAACYTRTNLTNGSAVYHEWNATVTNNTWYQTYCGGDGANYYNQSQGANPKYTVTAIQGVGIGNWLPVY